ncbi:hypothetical protein V2S66_24390 [Streptomyces sp. V4-01]|uniref:Ig-like domain-containing protein n=1 Tax=Actinacidiphila polyblastidii TaxID=3110430 RepID=A0ABU7PH00_9ACTN|nr:hypothetical protein [Streptomyces sp. V4-01]
MTAQRWLTVLGAALLWLSMASASASASASAEQPTATAATASATTGSVADPATGHRPPAATAPSGSAAAPGAVSPHADPSGCTTSVAWVVQGNNYFYGKGSVQCTTGRYKAKLVCRNNQTGTAYALYGTEVVNAPATASATCNTGNTAETVQAVADPVGTGLTGCVTWAEWVTQGTDHFYGRGSVQCDSGQYHVKIVCRNNQTGTAYVISGTEVVSAPATTSAVCNTGNTAETVQAALSPATGTSGCVTWTDWVTEGSSHFYGKGSAQCDSGQYQVKIVCRDQQSGTAYLTYGATVGAPNTSIATCRTGNTAETVQAAPYPASGPASGCVTWTDWVTEGSSHFYGKGSAQCDSGQYRVQATCYNNQTGQTYILYGPTVGAPSVSTVTCYTGNTAQSLVAQPQ